MGPELLSIGAAARRVGVATSTLRYYDERGLVPPHSRVGSRRLYGQVELRRLAFIRMAQQFEIDLERIRAVLDGTGPPWHAVVEHQIEVLGDRARNAEAARRLLQHARQCAHRAPWRDCPYLIEMLDRLIAAGGDMAFPEDPGLAGLRSSYERDQLGEEAVTADPLEEFRRWLHQALEAHVPEPNAMILATADRDGMPSARTVLLKGLDERGFAFYTNLGSAKAGDLEARPVAALVFPWHAMERQVRVSGHVTRISREECGTYFASRPRESQLGAWASAQSEVVPDRAALDRAYEEVAARWPVGADIPLPDFWGGYRVEPAVYEFWQGRTGRLHDRLRYRLVEGSWVRERLAP